MLLLFLCPSRSGTRRHCHRTHQAQWQTSVVPRAPRSSQAVCICSLDSESGEVEVGGARQPSTKGWVSGFALTRLRFVAYRFLSNIQSMLSSDTIVLLREVRGNMLWWVRSLATISLASLYNSSRSPCFIFSSGAHTGTASGGPSLFLLGAGGRVIRRAPWAVSPGDATTPDLNAQWRPLRLVLRSVATSQSGTRRGCVPGDTAHGTRKGSNSRTASPPNQSLSRPAITLESPCTDANPQRRKQ